MLQPMNVISLKYFSHEFRIFIHSFIPRIYIAPLQGTYSEALPAQPRLNREDLSRRQKAGILLRGIKRSSSGSPFQVEGPTIEKARRCLRHERARGTRSSPLAEERRARRGLGQRQDDRGQKGRMEHNQQDTAKLTLLSCKRCAARQEASAKHRACKQRLRRILEYDQ